MGPYLGQIPILMFKSLTDSKQKVEQFAFHGLENLEYFEMKNNPMLESIHPKAFYDAIDEVGTPYPVQIFF